MNGLQIIDMRRAGLKWREIAERCGKSRQWAYATAAKYARDAGLKEIPSGPGNSRRPIDALPVTLTPGMEKGRLRYTMFRQGFSWWEAGLATRDPDATVGRMTGYCAMITAREWAATTSWASWPIVYRPARLASPIGEMIYWHVVSARAPAWITARFGLLEVDHVLKVANAYAERTCLPTPVPLGGEIHHVSDMYDAFEPLEVKAYNLFTQLCSTARVADALGAELMSTEEAAKFRVSIQKRIKRHMTKYRLTGRA